MRKPYLIAIVMTASITLWMASGLFSSDDNSSVTENKIEKNQLTLVQTEVSVAESVQTALTVQGHVEPNRTVILRSDIEGRIDKIYVEDGDWVEKGSMLARVAIEDRQIKLAREKALLASREQALTRAKALSNKDYQLKSVLEDAYFELKSAEASVAQIEFEINKLEIRAPFSGVLDARMIEVGDYVIKNGEIGRFIENSVLIAAAQIAQQNIQLVKLGAEAEITLATGETRQGKVNYISPLARESTRTFRVKIVIDNSDRTLPAGISAEIKLPTQKVLGHFVSPAILSLDNSGQMGVKIVDENYHVAFYPVDIIQATTKGVWLKGLPETAEIITIGQGFVEDGEKVDVNRPPVINEKTTSTKAIEKANNE